MRPQQAMNGRPPPRRPFITYCGRLRGHYPLHMSYVTHSSAGCVATVTKMLILKDADPGIVLIMMSVTHLYVFPPALKSSFCLNCNV